MDWDRNWPWCHGCKLVWVSRSIFNVGAGDQGPPLSNGDPTNIYPLFLSSVLQCSNPREKRWTASLNALWMRWEPCGQTIDTSYLLIVLKYLRNKICTNVHYIHAKAFRSERSPRRYTSGRELTIAVAKMQGPWHFPGKLLKITEAFIISHSLNCLHSNVTQIQSVFWHKELKCT